MSQLVLLCTIGRQVHTYLQRRTTSAGYRFLWTPVPTYSSPLLPSLFLPSPIFPLSSLIKKVLAWINIVSDISLESCSRGIVLNGQELRRLVKSPQPTIFRTITPTWSHYGCLSSESWSSESCSHAACISYPTELPAESHPVPPIKSRCKTALK
jgi:hypothetical protein